MSQLIRVLVPVVHNPGHGHSGCIGHMVEIAVPAEDEFGVQWLAVAGSALVYGRVVCAFRQLLLPGRRTKLVGVVAEIRADRLHHARIARRLEADVFEASAIGWALELPDRVLHAHPPRKRVVAEDGTRAAYIVDQEHLFRPVERPEGRVEEGLFPGCRRCRADPEPRWIRLDLESRQPGRQDDDQHRGGADGDAGKPSCQVAQLPEGRIAPGIDLVILELALSVPVG